MPTYKFLCLNCSIEFEKIIPASKRDNGYPCVSCGNTVQRQVSTSNFAFQHKPTGPVPQNTGVASIDYNYDKVIGRDAEQRWKTIEERRDAKIATVADERRKGRDVHLDHVTPTLDGTYRTLTQPEINKVNRDRKLALEYNKQLMKKDK